VHHKNVIPSRLPSMLLPCLHCGNRMVITASAPALYENGISANDLEDMTHTCVQCGMTLISTRRRAGADGVTPHRSRVEHRGGVRRPSPGRHRETSSTSLLGLRTSI
jgi:hypothetical protein